MRGDNFELTNGLILIIYISSLLLLLSKISRTKDVIQYICFKVYFVVWQPSDTLRRKYTNLGATLRSHQEAIEAVLRLVDTNGLLKCNLFFLHGQTHQ